LKGQKYNMDDLTPILIDGILNRKTINESHWDKRKTSSGKASVSKEYGQHKKRRNETGAAREQDARKRATPRGKKQAAHRDAVRRAEEQGKLKPPIGKACPKCGKTMPDRKSMVRDATQGYEKANALKGQYICRTCHNKKDNNKPGDTSTKSKRRTSGLGSISTASGDSHIRKANESMDLVMKYFRDNAGLVAAQGEVDPLIKEVIEEMGEEI